MALINELNNDLPRWLFDGNGRKFLDVLALGIDLFTEGVTQIWEHAVTYASSSDALQYLGRDRSLVPGLLETPQTFSFRLKNWRNIWKSSGNVYTILNQVALVWGPTSPKIRLVRELGWIRDGAKAAHWTTRNSDGTFEEHLETPSNFDWDGQDLKSRIFIIVYVPQTPLITEEGVYGDFLSDYGQDGVKPTDGKKGSLTIGTSAFTEYVQRTQYVVDLYKPAHVWNPFIIIAFDPSSFDPTAAAGSPGYPNGDWARNGIVSGNTYISARNTTARYWDGPK